MQLNASKSVVDDSCYLCQFNYLTSFQRLQLFGSSENEQSSSDIPASREMLDRRWANVVTYVGATSANDVGPTWICPSVQRWHNVATPPTMTLCQSFANVITYCIVIFDGWYYVCILFIPVNMP